MSSRRTVRATMIGGMLYALVPGCWSAPESPAQNPHTAPIHVEVLEVSPETFTETVVASGVARATVEYRVSAQVGGTLKRHNVNRGDRVEKGMVLFEMDTEEFQLLVKERTAYLDRTEAQFTFQEQERARNEPLYRDGLLSKAQWDRLLFDVAMAKAERDQARALLQQAERDLGLTTIRSPITGMVLERRHEAGEVVPRGTVLARIVNASRIIFEIGLSDLELRHVHKADRVDVTIDAIPGSVFPGEVTQISGNASPMSGSFPVEVTVDNPGFAILTGMVGRVELPGEVHRNRFILPLMAVQQRLQGTVVHVVEEGRVVEKPVTLGKVLGDRVLVRDGLTAGDRVVVVGQGRLETGDPVEVVQEESGPPSRPR